MDCLLKFMIDSSLSYLNRGMDCCYLPSTTRKKRCSSCSMWSACHWPSMICFSSDYHLCLACLLKLWACLASIFLSKCSTPVTFSNSFFVYWAWDPARLCLVYQWTSPHWSQFGNIVVILHPQPEHSIPVYHHQEECFWKNRLVSHWF